MKLPGSYRAGQNVRVNVLSPGRISTNRPEDFVKKFSALIPLGRMSPRVAYRAAALFRVSEVSSYDDEVESERRWRQDLWVGI